MLLPEKLGRVNGRAGAASLAVAFAKLTDHDVRAVEREITL
jgi:hypothetical protein